MKLNSISIDKFHNLKDVKVNFSDSKVIALIGNNGSGKSSVLESINTAFYLATSKSVNAVFDFEFTYALNEEICNFGSKDSVYSFYVNKKATKEYKQYLPNNIFTYYAGETQRLNQFAKYYQDYKKEYIDDIKNTNEVAQLNYFTSFSLNDFKLAFLVNYLFDTPIFSEIKKYIQFKSVDSNILLQLGKPDWASKNSKKEDLWGAKGFQKEFYNKLTTPSESAKSAIAVRLDDDSKDYKDEIWLGLLGKERIKEVAKTPLELFVQLRALMDVNLLQNIYITVFFANEKKGTDLDYLSEGQKQLTNLIMLLTLTKDYEALYLLDEFDAYLHPNWQREFVSIINGIDFKGQVIFTTHSPATISGMHKENVFIMKGGKIYPPSSETYNRALDEIMTENMDISMRPLMFQSLEQKFRNAVIHGNKEEAEKILSQIKEIVGKDDPFFITATMALSRME